MKIVVKWSVILALLVAALSIIIAVTGLHRNPVVGGLVSISIAIVINVAVVLMALRETAADNPYVKQLANGALLGLVAGLLIFLSSWLLLAVVFPSYLDEMREGYTAWLEASQLPPDQVQRQIEQMEQATPASQSITGLIGTFLTSLVAAAIIGIFVRKK